MQGELFKAPARLRGLWYRHLPDAVHIREWRYPLLALRKFDVSPETAERFYPRIPFRPEDHEHIRNFLVLEIEIGERVAAGIA